jgi:two-component system sensor histidine kinase DegS
MDPDVAADAPDGRMDGLLEEARAAVSSSANSLRSVRERYRQAHSAQFGRWELLRDELIRADRRDPHSPDGPDLNAIRRTEALEGREVGAERSALARIELAIRSLESAWLFLSRNDGSLIVDPESPTSPADAQMRIVEAQEAERSRLAREVHDGPAQALANAIFQVEIVERMLDRDEALARAELRLLRESLRRELDETRAYISQLRPPLLSDVGLGGAVRDTADQLSSVLGVPVSVEVDEGVEGLAEGVQTVILRVIQEALQNVRKHARANRIAVRICREAEGWTAEVRDDGRGFDTADMSIRGRRNFGLQFMRERAELVGAGFEVRSRADGGTVVRLSIPAGAEEST